MIKATQLVETVEAVVVLRLCSPELAFFEKPQAVQKVGTARFF